jgi:hypothetical protein
MGKVIRMTESQLRDMVRKALNEQPVADQEIDLHASECLQDKEKFKIINSILDSAKSNSSPVSAAFRALNSMIPGNPYAERLQKELMLLGNCIGLKGIDGDEQM